MNFDSVSRDGVVTKSGICRKRSLWELVIVLADIAIL